MVKFLLCEKAICGGPGQGKDYLRPCERQENKGRKEGPRLQLPRERLGGSISEDQTLVKSLPPLVEPRLVVEENFITVKNACCSKKKQSPGCVVSLDPPSWRLLGVTVTGISSRQRLIKE